MRKSITIFFIGLLTLRCDDVSYERTLSNGSKPKSLKSTLNGSEFLLHRIECSPDANCQFSCGLGDTIRLVLPTDTSKVMEEVVYSFGEKLCTGQSTVLTFSSYWDGLTFSFALPPSYEPVIVFMHKANFDDFHAGDKALFTQKSYGFSLTTYLEREHRVTYYFTHLR